MAVLGDLSDIRYTPPAPTNNDGDFKRGLKQGWEETKGLGYGLVGAAGAAVGNDALKRWGLDNAAERMATSELMGKPSDQLEGIDSVGSAIDWAQHGIGYLAPMVATSILGGGAGGIAGRAIAKRAVTGLAEDAAKAALAKGVERGAIAGAGAASYGQELGSIYPDMVQQGHDDVGRAMAFALPAAAFDLAPEARIFHNVLNPGAVEGAIRPWYRRAASEGLKQGALEGTTEGLQSVVERAAAYKPLNDQAAWSDYMNSAAVGALGGVAGGAPVGALRMGEHAPAPNPLPTTPDQATDLLKPQATPSFDAQVQSQMRPAGMPLQQFLDQQFGTTRQQQVDAQLRGFDFSQYEQHPEDFPQFDTSGRLPHQTFDIGHTGFIPNTDMQGIAEAVNSRPDFQLTPPVVHNGIDFEPGLHQAPSMVTDPRQGQLPLQGGMNGRAALPAPGSNPAIMVTPDGFAASPATLQNAQLQQRLDALAEQQRQQDMGLTDRGVQAANAQAAEDNAWRSTVMGAAIQAMRGKRNLAATLEALRPVMLADNAEAAADKVREMALAEQEKDPRAPKFRVFDAIHQALTGKTMDQFDQAQDAQPAMEEVAAEAPPVEQTAPEQGEPSPVAAAQRGDLSTAERVTRNMPRRTADEVMTSLQALINDQTLDSDTKRLAAYYLAEHEDAHAADKKGVISDARRWLKALADGQGKELLYSRAEALGPGMAPEAVQSEVERVTAKWKNAPRITVEDTPAADMPADARGVWTQGGVTLFASNLHSVEDVQRVLFHEVLGHHGLNGFFSKAELSTILNGLYANNPTLRQLATRWVENNAKLDEYSRMSPLELRERSIEEALAKLAEQGKEFSGFKQFMQMMQNALRSIGLDHVANWLEGLSNAEALSVLAQARQFVEGETATPTAEAQPAFSRPDAKPYALTAFGDEFYNNDLGLAQPVKESTYGDTTISTYGVYDPEGNFVGAVTMGVRNGKPNTLVNIIIEPEHTGQGWGEKVLRALADSSEDGVLVTNTIPSAVGFYQKMGLQWITDYKDHGDGLLTSEHYQVSRDPEGGNPEATASDQAADEVDAAQDQGTPRAYSRATESPYTAQTVKLGGLFSRAWDGKGNAWADSEGVRQGAKLGFMTNGQIVQWFGDKLATLKEFKRETEAAAVEKNQMVQEVGELDRKWQGLDAEQSKLTGNTMHYATLWGIHPDQEFTSEGNKHLTPADKDRYDQLRAGWELLSPEAQDVYTTARDLYAKFWEQRKAVVAELITSGYDQQIAQRKHQAAEARAAGDEETAKADEAAAERIAATRDKRIADHAAMINSIQGPYFALTRMGNHIVVAESPRLAKLRDEMDHASGTAKRALQVQVEELEKQPDHYRVEAFEKQSAADNRVAELQAAGMRARPRLADEVRGSQLGQGALGDLKSYLDTSDLDSRTKAEVTEMITDMKFRTLPEFHALKRQLKREGVAGAMAGADMHRGVIKTLQKDAHYLSQLKHADNLNDILYRMKREAEAFTGDRQMRRVFDEMHARHILDMQYNETPIQNNLGMLSFFSQLFLSPAQLIQNSLQPVTYTLPVLGGRYGAGRAMSALRSAWADTARVMKASAIDPASGKINWRFELDLGKLGAVHTTDEEFAAYKALDGKLGEQRVKFSPEKLRALQERDMVQQLLDRGRINITIEHDLGITVNAQNKYVAQAKRLAAWPIHHTEVLNRVSSALAAYRLAVEKQSHDAAVDYADRVVEDTQGNYDTSNAPRLMREGGGIPYAKLVFQFRRFQQFSIHLLVRNFRDAFMAGATAEDRHAARRTLAGILITQQMMAGALGIPLAWPLKALGSMLCGLLGDPEDNCSTDAMETEFRNWVTDVTGDAGTARVLAKGLPTLFGADLGNQISMGNILNPMPFARFDHADTGRGAMGDVLVALGGAPAGMVANWYDGVQLAAGGQVMKGLEKLLPAKAVTNLIKAARYETEGLTTRSGDVALESDKFDGWDLALRAAGISPVMESEHYAAQQAVADAEKSVMDTRKGLIRDWVNAQLRGEDTQDVQESIDAFNQRNAAKGQRIDRSTLLKSIQQQRQRLREMDSNGVRIGKRQKPYASEARFAEE